MSGDDATCAASALTCWRLNEDARFMFPHGDWYWTKHMQRGFYEREIDAVLRRAASRPYDFIDAGANYGYWSVLASSKPYGRRRALAIEASAENCRRLTYNARANGDRFETLHRAVLDISGRHMRLYGAKHYGLSLREDWHAEDAGHFEQVESVTLDEAAERYFPARGHPPLLKIDVEGVEIEAIRGAQRLIDAGALVIYEDHGKEATHRISRFVLGLGDLALWYLGRDGRTLRVAAIDEVAAVKTNRNLGYNFAAYRPSSPWATLFDEIAAVEP